MLPSAPSTCRRGTAGPAPPRGACAALPGGQAPCPRLCPCQPWLFPSTGLLQQDKLPGFVWVFTGPVVNTIRSTEGARHLSRATVPVPLRAVGLYQHAEAAGSAFHTKPNTCLAKQQGWTRAKPWMSLFWFVPAGESRPLGSRGSPILWQEISDHARVALTPRYVNIQPAWRCKP